MNQPLASHYVALALSILLVPLAQVLLKKGIRNDDTLAVKFFGWHSLCGLSILFFVTILSPYFYQAFEVKTITAWSSLIYLLVTIFCRFFLLENLTLKRLIGCGLITTGVLVFQFSPDYLF